LAVNAACTLDEIDGAPRITSVELAVRDVVPGLDAGKFEQIVGERMVDCVVDAVGFEAKGHGHGAEEAPATVLNSGMEVTREAGKLGIIGLYVTGDPGAHDEAAKEGTLSIRIGLGWAKSHSFTTG
jgi:glutathione-independent formaldehyde dehydrogenase